MNPFRRTLCFHGYAGRPSGSVRSLMDHLVQVLGSTSSLGDCVFPELPFSAKQGAGFNDAIDVRCHRMKTALEMPWGELSDTLIVGLSMGGLLGALLAQRQPVRSIVALSAPDSLNPELGVDVGINLPNLLAVYSSKDDQVIHGRTLSWPVVTPYAFDLDGVTHNHDAHRTAFTLPMALFLTGRTPQQIRFALEEAEGDVAPF